MSTHNTESVISSSFLQTQQSLYVCVKGEDRVTKHAGASLGTCECFVHISGV